MHNIDWYKVVKFCCNFQGNHVWLPTDRGNFCVPIGGVVTAHDRNGVKIVDDDGKVNFLCKYISSESRSFFYKFYKTIRNHGSYFRNHVSPAVFFWLLHYLLQTNKNLGKHGNYLCISIILKKLHHDLKYLLIRVSP